MDTHHDDPNNNQVFQLTIEPDEGMYKGGHFVFDFDVPDDYPHKPPKVKCRQKIYHPNIDTDGNVCLNILREDWKPVLNLNAIFVGLQVCLLYMDFLERHVLTPGQFLFLEPNASDPLNKEAAEDLKQNREGFKRNVRASMGGGTVKGVSYARVLK